MTLWIVFAFMTAAAIVAVMWPLGRGRGVAEGGSDVLVYKDQLREIDRDRAAGLIGDTEAEAARIEVSRRLLAAADSSSRAAVPTDSATWNTPRRAALLAMLVVLPFGPPILYVALGSPNLPGQPAYARSNNTPRGNESIVTLVGQVETHLARNPNDGAGWELLAPVYMGLGRFDDAVAARRKALTLNGETATREADLGEAMVAAANGVVTVEAKAKFQRAITDDPHEFKARYFLGLAAQQDGNEDEAASAWRALLAEAPAGAPWVEFVRGALARSSGAAAVAAPGPTAADVEEAANLSEDQRRDKIRGMVARLADRLHADGADNEGWVRLVRAYVVLGDRDKAKSAAADAKRALAAQPEQVKRIDELVKGLGLED